MDLIGTEGLRRHVADDVRTLLLELASEDDLIGMEVPQLRLLDDLRALLGPRVNLVMVGAVKNR